MSRLARHYGVSVEWLLDGVDSPSVSLRSETMRFAAAKVSNTVGALMKHYGRKGFTLDLRTDRDAERFLLTYQAVTELPPEPTEDDLIEFGSKLEAIAPLSEGMGDGRTVGVPAGGEVGRGVGEGRSRHKAGS